MAARGATGTATFDAQAVLESAGVATAVVRYSRSETVFVQGEASDSVIYILEGGLELSAVSKVGRRVVVAILGPGDFCGEGGLAGQEVRTATATALTPTSALVIGKTEMISVLHAEHALSDCFIRFILNRSIRIEEDLIAHLVESGEKRLARTLLLLARYGMRGRARRFLPGISLAMLTDMVGTTSSRVSLLLKKFERQGFIQHRAAGIRINGSLLTVLLRD